MYFLRAVRAKDYGILKGRLPSAMDSGIAKGSYLERQILNHTSKDKTDLGFLPQAD